MTSTEIWVVAYMIAIGRGDEPSVAREKAYQAIEDYENFRRDTNER